MIRERKSLSMAESLEFTENARDEGKEIKGFVRKFSKIKPEKAKELRKELEKLDIVKISDSDISKIIDILPENTEELNKVVTGVSFEEEESKKILEVTKEYA